MNIDQIVRNIVADDLRSNYRYDPTHKHKPKGGGTWTKTTRGWSKARHVIHPDKHKRNIIPNHPIKPIKFKGRPKPRPEDHE